MKITQTKIEGTTEKPEMFQVIGEPVIIEEDADIRMMEQEARHYIRNGCKIITLGPDRFIAADENGELKYLIDLV